jgi:hypothetical protein
LLPQKHSDTLHSSHTKDKGFQIAVWCIQEV